MSQICIRRTKEVSFFAIIVGFALNILQMHDSNGKPILALPPVSDLYGIERVHV
jgi:hypothetical protein